MSVDVIKDMGHSVNARLKSLAGQRRVGFDYLLLRYACERFLFRLGRSEHSSRFILKGACAFSVWFGTMFRVTRDTDFLCHGNPAPEHLVQCFRDICATEVPDDGVRFDALEVVLLVIWIPWEGILFMGGNAKRLRACLPSDIYHPFQTWADILESPGFSHRRVLCVGGTPAGRMALPRKRKLSVLKRCRGIRRLRGTGIRCPCRIRLCRDILKEGKAPSLACGGLCHNSQARAGDHDCQEVPRVCLMGVEYPACG